jgi:hypothetical protein
MLVRAVNNDQVRGVFMIDPKISNNELHQGGRHNELPLNNIPTVVQNSRRDKLYNKSCFTQIGLDLGQLCSKNPGKRKLV